MIHRTGVDLRSTKDHRAPITEEGGHGAVQDGQAISPEFRTPSARKKLRRFGSAGE